MVYLPLRPNPLVYPGSAPSFNPSHVAARGCKFAAVARGTKAVNLVNNDLSTTNGTFYVAPTYALDPFLGPCTVFSGNIGNGLQFTNGGTTTSDAIITFAAIVTPDDVSNASYVTNCTNSAVGATLWSSGTLLLNFNGQGNISSTISLSTKVPYFIAVSAATQDGSTWTANFIAKNLITGVVQTYSTSGNAINYLPGDGSVIFGGNAYTGILDAYGRIACAMHGNGVFLSIGQLRQWSEDPWSFWYPRAEFDLLSLFTASVTAQVQSGFMLPLSLRDGRIKPYTNGLPRINWEHPMSRGLQAQFVTPQHNIVSGRRLSCYQFGSSAVRVATPFGEGKLVVGQQSDGDKVNFNPTNGGSCEAWFVATSPSTAQTLVAFGDNTFTTPGPGSTILAVNSNTLNFQLNSSFTTASGGAISAGNLYHGVATWDGSGNAILYLNGAQVGTATGTVTSNSPCAFYSGTNGNYGDQLSPIISASCANRPWTAAEVRQRYIEPYANLIFPEDELISVFAKSSSTASSQGGSTLPMPMLDKGKLYTSGVPRINWDHPITRGLIAAYLPGTIARGKNLTGRTSADLVGGSYSGVPYGFFKPGPDGMGWDTSTNLFFGGLSTGDAIAAGQTSSNPSSVPSAEFLTWASGAKSVYYRGNLTLQVNDPQCFGILDNNRNNAPYTMMHVAVTTTGQVYCDYNDGVSYASTIEPGSTYSARVASPQTISIGGTLMVGGNAAVYADGKLLQSGAAPSVAPVCTAAQANITLNGFPSWQGTPFGQAYCGYIWNRELNAAEMRLLHNDPYCFLIFPEDELASTFARPGTVTTTPPPVGGTQFLKTISAAATSAVSAIKSVGKIITAACTSSHNVVEVDWQDSQRCTD
jgi:hypothetical protein